MACCSRCFEATAALMVREALPRAEALTAAVEKVAYRAIQGEALLLESKLRALDGQVPVAAELARRAGVRAAAGGDDALAVRAWAHLAFVDCTYRTEFVAARESLEMAEAAFEKIGRRDVLLEKEILLARGGLAFGAGRWADALVVDRELVTILERALGLEAPELASPLHNLAASLKEQGLLDEAHEMIRRSIVLRERYWGSEARKLGESFNVLGAIESSRRRSEEALAAYRQALTVFARTLGERSSSYAMALGNVALVEARLGRNEMAIRTYRTAVDIQREVSGPSSEPVANILSNMSHASHTLNASVSGSGSNSWCSENELIDTNKRKLAEASFNHPGVGVEYLHITPSHSVSLKLHLQMAATGAMPWEADTYSGDIWVVAGALPEPRPELREKIIKDICVMSSLGELAGAMELGDPVFLPASRTGFMLLYKSVVRKQIDQLRRSRASREQNLNLPTPAIKFLDLLAVGLQPELGPYADEALFLENALGGKVELSTDVGVNDYYYRPDGGDRLDMSIVSSLVTELAPVILVLRHLKSFPVLLLEEPEAHLHPTMQRHLARTIVRLIRKGLYVWITTHSENFCQQINNFLKIGCSPRRAELQAALSYDEREYLTLDDVSGYGFTIEGDKSKVSALKRTPRGLVMPTFNRELTELTKETLFLQRETAAQE